MSANTTEVKLKRLTLKVATYESKIKLLEARNTEILERLANVQGSYANLTTAMSHLVVGAQKELDRLDLVCRTTTYVIHEMFGHQAQVLEYLKVVRELVPKDRLDQMPTLEELGAKATEWYYRVFEVMHKRALAEHAAELRKAEDERVAEVKTQMDRDELVRVQEEVKTDEQRLSSAPGGQGAEYPPEAFIYGGEGA